MVLALGDSSKWDLFWQETYTPQEGYVLGEIPIPLQNTASLLAVLPNTDPLKNTWHFGGILNQRVAINVIGGGLINSGVISAHTLTIAQVNLIVIPKITDSYALSIKVPDWFYNYMITIWNFKESFVTNPITGIEDIQYQLLEVENTLAQLQQSVDDLQQE